MLKIRRMLKSQAGFTLVELIIVVVILATLAGIALLNSGGAEDDAKTAKYKADMDSISTALKVFKMKTGAYPTSTEKLDALTASKTTKSGTYKPMLDSIPKSPYGDYDYSITSGTATLTNGVETTDPNYYHIDLK